MTSKHSTEATNESSIPSVEKSEGRIHEGYVPGCIGDVASLHARYYSQAWGLNVLFEKQVATELAEFTASLPAPGKALWLYMENGRTLASIAINGDETSRIAYLRWFLVHESLRGLGIGRRLLSLALAFADERFDETHLSTFKGLDAARHLYESFGFQLTQESPGSPWGTTIMEQRFIRRLG